MSPSKRFHQLGNCKNIFGLQALKRAPLGRRICTKYRPATRANKTAPETRLGICLGSLARPRGGSGAVGLAQAQPVRVALPAVAGELHHAVSPGLARTQANGAKSLYARMNVFLL
jgi:hypothetical protein